MPGGGVEPPRPEGRRILSPLRLPVPPSRLGKVFLLYGTLPIVKTCQAGCGFATGTAIMGSSTLKLEPSPGLLSTPIDP